VTEGPYHLDLGLVRRDITGHRRGTALALRFVVVDASTCKPIPDAKVEIWHADASGPTAASPARAAPTCLADTSNGADGIYRQAGTRALMSLERKGRRVSSGYTGRLTIGVQA
jgi:protocatechuate 3,4-dioxygenase beta subunit